MTIWKDFLDFSRAEIFALAILLLMALVGGSILLYENSTRTLPPELIFETVKAESRPPTLPAKTPAKDSIVAPKKSIPSTLLMINLNTAPAESLMMLPHVGKVISQRIIEYREKRGGFDSVGQVIEIKGIGKKRLEAIRKLVTVGK